MLPPPDEEESDEIKPKIKPRFKPYGDNGLTLEEVLADASNAPKKPNQPDKKIDETTAENTAEKAADKPEQAPLIPKDVSFNFIESVKNFFASFGVLSADAQNNIKSLQNSDENPISQTASVATIIGGEVVNGVGENFAGLAKNAGRFLLVQGVREAPEELHPVVAPNGEIEYKKGGFGVPGGSAFGIPEGTKNPQNRDNSIMGF